MFRSPPNKRTQTNNCFFSFVSDLCRSPDHKIVPSRSKTQKIKIAALKRKEVSSPAQKAYSKTFHKQNKESLHALRAMGPLQQYYNNLVKAKAQKKSMISKSPDITSQKIQQLRRMQSPPASRKNNTQIPIYLSPHRPRQKLTICVVNQNQRNPFEKFQIQDVAPVLMRNREKKNSKWCPSTKVGSQLFQDDSKADTHQTHQQQQKKSIFDNGLLKITNLQLPKYVVSVATSSLKDQISIEESIVLQRHPYENKRVISRLF